jgi:hypothetical protein
MTEKCKICNKPLVPFNDKRKNGKEGEYWGKKEQTHLKCYIRRKEIQALKEYLDLHNK